MPSAVVPVPDLSSELAAVYQRVDVARVREVLAAQGVADFEAEETGWTAGSAVTTEPYVGEGKQSLKLTSTNEAYTIANRALPAAVSYDITRTPIFEILYHVDDITKLNAMVAYCGTGGGVTKSIRTGCGSTVNRPYANGWNLLRVKVSDMTKAGGWADSDWTSVDYVRVLAQAVAGQTVNVHITSVRLVKPMPIVFLNHDDGDVNAKGFWDIEERYGLRSTNYIITGLVGTAGYMEWSDIEGAYNRGHDVANHTDANQRLSEYASDEARTAAIRAGYRELQQRRFRRSAMLFAAPFGETSGNIPALIAAEGYPWNRAGGALWATYAYPVTNRFTLLGHTTVGETSAPTLATATAYIDTLMAEGTAGFLLFHKLDVAGEPSLSWSTAKYTALCRYIARYRDAGELACMTGSEYLYGSAPIIEANGRRFMLGVDETNALTATRIS